VCGQIHVRKWLGQTAGVSWCSAGNVLNYLANNLSSTVVHTSSILRGVLYCLENTPRIHYQDPSGK